MRPPQLRMEKNDLGHVPDVPVPNGYALRTYREGDEYGLARVYLESQLSDGTAETVRRTLVSNPCFKPERVFIVEHAGAIIGTAAAWVETERDPGVGYLHMVGLLPEHRGHRLGALLTVEAIRYSCHEGYHAQRLLTDDFREPAVRLYLDLGYYPLYTDPSHPQRWAALADKLNRHQAIARARNLL